MKGWLTEVYEDAVEDVPELEIGSVSNDIQI